MIICRTKVFVLKVNKLLDVYDDAGHRKRAWFSLEEAGKLLVTCKPLHCKYLAAMEQTRGQEILANNSNNSQSSAPPK